MAWWGRLGGGALGASGGGESWGILGDRGGILGCLILKAFGAHPSLTKRHTFRLRKRHSPKMLILRAVVDYSKLSKKLSKKVTNEMLRIYALILSFLFISTLIQVLSRYSVHISKTKEN